MNEHTENVIAALTTRDIHLFLGPRPGKRSRAAMSELNLTHCCTLLSEREDAQSVARICQNLGCAWVWLPMDGGRLDVLRQTDVAGQLDRLTAAIAAEPEPRIYFHCSAGIHRTGFFVYILLRLRGASRDEALQALRTMRPVTAEQVGAERIDLADEIIAALTSG